MKYATQRNTKRELDARVPRGPKGSPQNKFRCAMYFFNSQGYPFDVSVGMAASLTNEHHPGFSPRVTPRAAL